MSLIILILLFSPNGAWTAETGGQRLCVSKLEIRFVDLFGSWADITKGPGAAFVEISSIRMKSPKRVDLKEPIFLPCGEYSFRSFIGGGRSEQFSAVLEDGITRLLIGIRVGNLRPPETSISWGVIPSRARRCRPIMLRAVPVFGQFSAIQAAVQESGEFSIKDIPPGRYSIAIAFDLPECPVELHFATVKLGRVLFDKNE